MLLNTRGVRGRVARSFVLVTAVWFTAAAPAAGQRPSAPSHLSAPGYYIALRAAFYFSDDVEVWGSTNVPSGSILDVYVYDQGMTVLSRHAFPVVGEDGSFQATVRPRAGAKFRKWLFCNATFDPRYPTQPAKVLKIVGKIGQHLITAAYNPQLQKDSSGRGALLYTTTVVTE